MSYLASEQSVHDSQPIELYKFVGTYATYRYTSAPEDVVYDDGGGAQTYTAINIDRDEVSIGTQDDDGLNITVVMSVLQAVAIDYAFTVSPPNLDLTVYRMQPDETIVYWTGPVNNITVLEGGRAQFNCPSALGAALTANVPNVYYQTPCNNVLYGPQCQVDFALFSFVTSVTAISADGKTITVGGIGTLDGKMIGGEIALTNGERRMVVEQTADALVVNFPFSRIEVGIACTIAAGCDQNYTGDCKAKFNNQIHFTGFRFIPPVNPFVDGIQPAEEGVTDDACVFVHETFIAEMVVRWDQGLHSPLSPASSYGLTMKRGGVTQASIDASLGLSVQVDQVMTITMVVGGAGYGLSYDENSFADGPPDEITFSYQFNDSAFDCGGSPLDTDGACGGYGSLTFRLPNGEPLPTTVVSGQTQTPYPLFELYRLFPKTVQLSL